MKSKAGTGARGRQERRDWIEAARKNLANWQAEAEPGATYPPLIQWLSLAVAERGITLSDLAQQLGVTYGYIAQMKSGMRDPACVSDYFVDSVAAFLDLPRISVLRICGKVSLQEFESGPSPEHFMASAFAFIERDPVWGAVMPPWLRSLPKDDWELRSFVVRLYQAATGRVLIPELEPGVVVTPSARANRKAVAKSADVAPPLIHWLTLAAAERGITLGEVAKKLNVTYGYISHLRSGVRKLSSVDDKFVDGVVGFLGLPRISVLAACGRVKLEDFVSGGSPEQSIDQAFAFLERDKDWGEDVRRLSARMADLKAKELNRLAKLQADAQAAGGANRLPEPRADSQVKLFVVRLYEAATGKALIPYRDPIPARAPPVKGRAKKELAKTYTV